MAHRSVLIFACCISLITWSFAQENELRLCDDKATKETMALYSNLHKIAKRGYIFGHQDALAYGVNWRYEEGRSDVKEVVGDYPGLYGWDLAGLERGSKKDINGIPFSEMKKYIRQGYERGGVITFSWHMDNPVTGRNSWDTTRLSLTKLLPGGACHSKYRDYLDRASEFLKNLKGEGGEMIPVIFRPFHELTGDWFWWCKHANSKDDFINIWRFTVDYLKNKKNLHHLIYCYNVADFEDEAGLMEYYPGDEYVDIISFDLYQKNGIDNEDFINLCQKRFKIMKAVTDRNHKLIAMAEAGYEAIPYAHWWTEVLDKALSGSNISYVLMWRNHGMQADKTMHYYAPYAGHASAQDFIEFYKKRETFFESDLHQFSMYKSDPAR